MNIFVAKLNSRTSSEDLKRAFSEFGEVTSSKVIMDYETGNSKGFGFVEMADQDAAYEAIEALNESELDGNVIVVKKAKPRNTNNGGRGNNFNRRY